MADNNRKYIVNYEVEVNIDKAKKELAQLQSAFWESANKDVKEGKGFLKMADDQIKGLDRYLENIKKIRETVSAPVSDSGIKSLATLMQGYQESFSGMVTSMANAMDAIHKGQFQTARDIAQNIKGFDKANKSFVKSAVASRKLVIDEQLKDARRAAAGEDSVTKKLKERIKYQLKATKLKSGFNIFDSETQANNLKLGEGTRQQWNQYKKEVGKVIDDLLKQPDLSDGKNKRITKWLDEIKNTGYIGSTKVDTTEAENRVKNLSALSKSLDSALNQLNGSAGYEQLTKTQKEVVDSAIKSYIPLEEQAAKVVDNIQKGFGKIDLTENFSEQVEKLSKLAQTEIPAIDIKVDTKQVDDAIKKIEEFQRLISQYTGAVQNTTTSKPVEKPVEKPTIDPKTDLAQTKEQYKKWSRRADAIQELINADNEKIEDLYDTGELSKKMTLVNKAIEHLTKNGKISGINQIDLDETDSDLWNNKELEKLLSECEAFEKIYKNKAKKLQTDIDNELQAHNESVLKERSGSSSSVSAAKKTQENLASIGQAASEVSKPIVNLTGAAEGAFKHLADISNSLLNIPKDIHINVVLDGVAKQAEQLEPLKKITSKFVLDPESITTAKTEIEKLKNALVTSVADTKKETQKAQEKEVGTVNVKGNITSVNQPKDTSIDVKANIIGVNQPKTTPKIEVRGIVSLIETKKGLNKKVNLTGVVSKLNISKDVKKEIKLTPEVSAASLKKAVNTAKKDLDLKIKVTPTLGSASERSASLKALKESFGKFDKIFSFSGATEQITEVANKLKSSVKDIPVSLETAAAATKLDELIAKVSKLKEPITINVKEDVKTNEGGKGKGGNKTIMTPFQQGFKSAMIGKDRKAGRQAFERFDKAFQEQSIAPFANAVNNKDWTFGGKLGMNARKWGMYNPREFVTDQSKIGSALMGKGFFNPKNWMKLEYLSAKASDAMEGFEQVESRTKTTSAGKLSLGNYFKHMRESMEAFARDMNSYKKLKEKAEHLVNSGSLKRQRKGHGMLEQAYPMMQNAELRLAQRKAKAFEGLVERARTTNAQNYVMSKAAPYSVGTGEVVIPMLGGRAFSSKDFTYQSQGSATTARQRTKSWKYYNLGNHNGRGYGRSGRSQLYQWIGNTSFGSNTPMAVQMFRDMGVMAAVGGLMGAISNSMMESVHYQNTMKTAEAILKRTDSEHYGQFTGMKNTVRSVGKETKFTAPEVAEASRFMAMAGMKIGEIKQSIKPIADVALIGDTDLGETADKMTNIMTTYRKAGKMMDTRKMADMLTSTFTNTNTDMMMLAESMQYAGGIANASHLPLNQLLAMIGIMGNSGIQASMAGTTMRMMMQNVINPNKGQREMWNALGIKTRNSDGTTRNLMDILSEVEQKSHTLGYEDKLDQVVSRLFRVTSTAGAVALIQNMGQVKSLAAKNASVSGLSEAVSNEKKNTIQGLWAKVTSSFTEMGVQIFEKNLAKIIESLKKLVKIFDDKNTLQLFEKIITTLMDLGKMIFSIAGMWLKVFNKFSFVFKYMMYYQLLANQIKFAIGPFVQFRRTIVDTLSAIVRLNNGLRNVGNSDMTDSFTDLLINNFGANLDFSQDRVARAIALRKKLGWKKTMQSVFSTSFGFWGRTLGFGSLKGGVSGLFKNLAITIAGLVGPVTLAIGAIAALGYGIYKLVETINDATDKARSNLAKSRSALATTNAGTAYGNKIIATVNGNKNVLGDAAKRLRNTIKTSRNNPMLKNSREFKDIYASNWYTYTHPQEYAENMWRNHIYNMRKYIKGGVKWNSFKDINTGIAYIDDIKSAAEQGSIAQLAIKSQAAGNATAGIDYWMKWRRAKEAKNEWNDNNKAIYSQNINAIRNQYANWGKSRSIAGLDLSNMRKDDIINSQEGRYALFSYVDDYIKKCETYANNTLLQASESISQIMIHVNDLRGKAVDFTLPIDDNGNVAWENLFNRFQAMGLWFHRSIGEKLSWAMSCLDQLDQMGKLSPEIVENMLRSTLKPGQKLPPMYRDFAKQWFNDIYINTSGGQYWLKHGGVEGWLKHGWWSSIPNLATIISHTTGWDKNFNKPNQGKNGKGGANKDFNGMLNEGKKGHNKFKVPETGNKTDGYKSRYNQQAGRPTQINFNITNLANFANTEIKKFGSDDQAMVDALQDKITTSVYQLFAQAANAYSGVINQNDIV